MSKLVDGPKRRPRVCTVILASILSGCLASAKPLITDNAVFPIEAGSVFQEYDASGADISPRRDGEGNLVTWSLDIVDSFYIASSSDKKQSKLKFRFSEIANSPFLIMMLAPVDGSEGPFVYELVEKRNDFFVTYAFAKEHFLEYKSAMEETAPARWSLYSSGNPWRVIDDDRIDIDSLAFLEIILPQMARGGFHLPGVWAYKPIERREASSATQSRVKTDSAADAQIAACLNAAASPSYAQFAQLATRGVRREDVVAATAIPACQDAHRTAPENLDVIDSLGRALDVAGRHEEAVRYFRLAAERGHVDAQTALGWSLANGEGTSKNEVEAVRFWRLAADQGYAQAQSNLGYAYATGMGVQRDLAEAARLYRLAIDQDNEQAKINLLALYSEGYGRSSPMAFDHQSIRNPGTLRDFETVGIVARHEGTDMALAYVREYWMMDIDRRCSVLVNNTLYRTNFFSTMDKGLAGSECRAVLSGFSQDALTLQSTAIVGWLISQAAGNEVIQCPAQVFQEERDDKVGSMAEQDAAVAQQLYGCARGGPLVDALAGMLIVHQAFLDSASR